MERSDDSVPGRDHDQPGRFNPWGTIIAVYFLVTGITGLQLMGVKSFVQELFFGGLS